MSIIQIIPWGPTFKDLNGSNNVPGLLIRFYSLDDFQLASVTDLIFVNLEKYLV